MSIAPNKLKKLILESLVDSLSKTDNIVDHHIWNSCSQYITSFSTSTTSLSPLEIKELFYKDILPSLYSNNFGYSKKIISALKSLGNLNFEEISDGEDSNDTHHIHIRPKMDEQMIEFSESQFNIFSQNCGTDPLNTLQSSFEQVENPATSDAEKSCTVQGDFSSNTTDCLVDSNFGGQIIAIIDTITNNESSVVECPQFEIIEDLKTSNNDDNQDQNEDKTSNNSVSSTNVNENNAAEENHDENTVSNEMKSQNEENISKEIQTEQAPEQHIESNEQTIKSPKIIKSKQLILMDLDYYMADSDDDENPNPPINEEKQIESTIPKITEQTEKINQQTSPSASFEDNSVITISDSDDDEEITKPSNGKSKKLIEWDCDYYMADDDDDDNGHQEEVNENISSHYRLLAQLLSPSNSNSGILQRTERM